MQRSKLLRRSCIVGAAAAIVPAASLSLAQTRNWIGATNSDWSTASNWDTGVPNSSTSATFTGGTSQNQSVIINSPNSACFFLTDSGIQQIQAGSYPLAVGGDLNIYPQPGAGPANLALQSGTISVAGNTNVGGTSSGSVGAGYLEIDSGGTLNVTGTTTIWSNGLPNSNGALNLSGGTLSTEALNDGNNPSLLNWTSGTLSITSPNPFNIQSGQPLGGIVTLNSGMTLSLSNAQYVSEVGSVTINPGGQLNCANFLVGNGGNANLAISGGSFGCSGLTIVGNGSSNSGALNVSGGGSLTTAILYDGLASSGTNTITVSGSGSTIVASSVIYVGSQNGGPSQFNVLSGGSVRANSSSGYVTVGSGGGNGVLTLGTAGTIDSGASLSSAGGIYVGGDSTSYVGSLGTGVVNVYSGTTLSTPGLLKIWPNGRVNLSGGTIIAGSVVSSGIVSIDGTGDLSAAGTLQIDGNVSVGYGRYGMFDGGEFSAASMNIGGTFYDLGTLLLRIPEGTQQPAI